MYVQGAEAWAADILRQDLVDSPDSDHLAETVGDRAAGAARRGRHDHRQARGPARTVQLEQPHRWRTARKISSRASSSNGCSPALDLDPALAGGVVDWLDPDTELRFPSGGEDVAYVDDDPPYRTANSMITSTSELMAIEGFDRETYDRLAPYIAVLPRGTKLNVNTASDVLLASLSDDIDIATAGRSGRGARRRRLRRYRGDVLRPRRARRARGNRRRQRALLVDRDGDARVKSAHDALGAAARSERNHSGAIPQPRSRIAWPKRSSFVCPTPALQPGAHSTPWEVSSAPSAEATSTPHDRRWQRGVARRS